MRPLSRRDFLGSGLALGAAAMIGGCASVSSSPSRDPFAIVGAGLAGLNAARYLDGKLDYLLFEGSDRPGGRVHTVDTGHGPMEMGGEFIDQNHVDMLMLADELNLRTEKVADESATTFDFGGNVYSGDQLMKELAPIASKLHRVESLPGIVGYRIGEASQTLDRMSMKDYLDSIGATGWSRSWLDVAMLSEYGVPTTELSALNLRRDMATCSWIPFLDGPRSRYRIAGGNGQICTTLAERFAAQLRYGHKLVAITQRLNGTMVLTFDKTGGGSFDQIVSGVLLTLPFSTLRAVDIRVELPRQKRRAIAELQYGPVAKIGYVYTNTQVPDAELYSDRKYQHAWSNDAKGMTVQLGGSDAARLSTGAVEAYRGFESALSTPAQSRGESRAFNWTIDPWSRGGRAYYKPDQWSAFGGAEAESVGNVFFAGEHCNPYWGGTMNGAVESGQRAAAEILSYFRVPA